MILNERFAAEDVSALLDAIAMPAAARTVLLDYFMEGLEVCDGAFEGLFSAETGADATSRLKDGLRWDERAKTPQNLRGLAVFICAALHTHRLYGQLGIGEEIFVDTMKAFSRFVLEHNVSFGCYGFDRFSWMFHALSATLFRLGTLEFEIKRAKTPIEGYVREGDSVLSVHIPSDALLTRENLDRSYDWARRFFREHFPDFEPKLVMCSTWLLAPALGSLLRPDSRIGNFRSDYRIVAHNDADQSYRVWLYQNREYKDLSELPEATSLQRSVKAFVLGGGVVGSGTGILI